MIFIKVVVVFLFHKVKRYLEIHTTHNHEPQFHNIRRHDLKLYV